MQTSRRGVHWLRMDVRFYFDPVTGQPHLERHGVTEEEAEDVLRRPDDDFPGRDGSRVALGRTSAGRPLQVVYVQEVGSRSLFVITAYELRGKALAAFRRRRREMSKTQFPPGWDDERVRVVLDHYESQSDEEAAAEHEAGLVARDQATVVVPRALLPEVRALIAGYDREKKAS